MIHIALYVSNVLLDEIIYFYYCKYKIEEEKKKKQLQQ